MSGGGVRLGAVYSPLPQSISDTESTEEELNNIVCSDNSKSVVTNKDSLDKRKGKKMGEYRPLGYDGEGEVSINGLPNHDLSTSDEIRIIKPEGSLPHHLEPMSPLRKVSFIISILLCGLTIVVFLWILPCDWATCPSASVRQRTKSWERTLQGLELKGGINVVAGVPGRGRNLVFLARGDIINAAQTGQDLRDFPASGGGLISLIGSTGEVAWYIHFSRTPHTMDCSLIDVTGDGAEDCIVVGTGKLLVAINPIPGSIVWHLHSHRDNRSAIDLEFPVVLPDLDGDGMRDLVTVCSFNDTSERLATVSDRNNFIVISGKKGEIIGQAVHFSTCTHIQGLSVDEEWNIVYTCQKADKAEASPGKISVRELYANAARKELTVSTYLQSPPLKQHQVQGVSSTVKKVNGHWLTLVNEGQCPNHCNATVKITDERHHNETVLSYQLDNTYGMVPVVLVFNSRSGTSTGGAFLEPISGFVLKFWTWTSTNSRMPSSAMKNSGAMNTTSTNPLFRYRLKRMVRSRMWADMHLGRERFSRSVITPVMQNQRNGTSIQVDFHQLKERVVLYTFNATDSHIVNASLNEVTQLCCHHGPSEKDELCQPDLHFQEQSLLIADLDQDGSQELVSFLTTYTNNNLEGLSVASDSSKWHLQSRVRVVRLEAELPKLYEAVARQ